jgi:predicted DNA-binding protein (UPF0251 family)
MSPRPFRLRKISNPPPVSGFKPYGARKNSPKTESVFLHFEEYEAIKLCDYEMLNHHQAAVMMVVSRPTLTRIYARARQKIAEALVMGKQIIIEGGKVYFDSEWLACKSCGCFFNNPEKQQEIKECPLCGSLNISDYYKSFEETPESTSHCNDICVCPSCHFERPHNFGFPCKNEICTVCGNHMVRKGTPHQRNQ